MFRKKRKPRPALPRSVVKRQQLIDLTDQLTKSTNQLADATARLNQERTSAAPVSPPLPRKTKTSQKNTENDTQSGGTSLPMSTRALIAFTAVVVLGIALVIAVVVVGTQIGFYRKEMRVQLVDLSKLGIDTPLDLPTFTPIATEGVAWACTLMAVVLVLLNRQSGLWTKSMWFFSGINAVVNAWHALDTDKDMLGAIVKGGLSIAGPFIVHLFILWVRHVRTGKTLAQARFDHEIKWRSIWDRLLLALGVFADHVTHPVVAVRAFSWWRLYRGASYGSAWKASAALKIARQRQRVQDERAALGRRKKRGERDGGESESGPAVEGETDDGQPEESGAPGSDPEWPRIELSSAQVDAAFDVLMQEMNAAAEKAGGGDGAESELGTTEPGRVEPVHGTGEAELRNSEPEDAAVAELGTSGTELVPAGERDCGTRNSEPVSAELGTGELVPELSRNPEPGSGTTELVPTRVRNSGTSGAELDGTRNPELGTGSGTRTEPGTRFRNRFRGRPELDGTRFRNSRNFGTRPELGSHGTRNRGGGTLDHHEGPEPAAGRHRPAPGQRERADRGKGQERHGGVEAVLRSVAGRWLRS